MKKLKLEALLRETGSPCVSISFNTHKAYPDYELDHIALKNLQKEALHLLLDKYDKDRVRHLIIKLTEISSKLDFTRSSNSTHIFISETMEEIVKSSLVLSKDTVHVANKFFVDHIQQEFQLAENHLILLLSQSGVQLFEATNDTITEEILSHGFPFEKFEHAPLENKSDGKKTDNLIREYFNKVDKSVVKIHNENKLNCVVISTNDNYSKLLQIADKKEIYFAHSKLNYNDVSHYQIGIQAYNSLN